MIPCFGTTPKSYSMVSTTPRRAVARGGDVDADVVDALLRRSGTRARSSATDRRRSATIPDDHRPARPQSKRTGHRRHRRLRRGGHDALGGKVAIVSGVGPGLGQANAHTLAKEGATVVLAARSADYLDSVKAEIEAAGGRALSVPTNLVDRERVDALVERTVSELGHIDILVNNAFRMDPYQPFEAGRPREVAQGLRRQRVGYALAHAGVHPRAQGIRRRSAATRRSCSSSR